MKLYLKPRARTDLLAIRAWGEDTWGPRRSHEFLQGLIEAIERLLEFPHLGRARPAFFPGLRSTRYRGYVIFYIPAADRIEVIAVLHERRNQAALDFADRIEES